MAIILDGSSLTIEKLVRTARYGEEVELDQAAVERIKVCRAMLEDKIRAHEIMYGVNTGIGEFSEVVLNDDQVQQFQKYLISRQLAVANAGHADGGLKRLTAEDAEARRGRRTRKTSCALRYPLMTQLLQPSAFLRVLRGTFLVSWQSQMPGMPTADRRD